TFNTSKSIYPSAKTFSRVKIYYGNHQYPFVLKTILNNEEIHLDTLHNNTPLNIKTISLNEPADNVELIFEGIESPDIYGISLDMPYGGCVDNIAMRGGSGTVFNKMDESLLTAMLRDFNTGLISMQFGGNVLPYIKDEKQRKDYGNWFYAQLNTLKDAVPDAAIIVIGPADMSIKQGEYCVTIPYLEDVRDALKDAAFKA